MLRQIPANLSPQTGGYLKLLPRDQDFGFGEMMQTAGMIRMQMGQHNPSHLFRRQTKRLHLIANFLIG